MDKKKGLSEYDKIWCNKILTELLKWPMTHPFRSPINSFQDDVSNYNKVIKKPMNFSIIKKKLIGNNYHTIKEFVNDIHLIATNAGKLNGENSLIYYMALDVVNWVDEKIKAKHENQNEEWRINLETVVDKLRVHIQKAPTSLSSIQIS